MRDQQIGRPGDQPPTATRTRPAAPTTLHGLATRIRPQLLARKNTPADITRARASDLLVVIGKITGIQSIPQS
jgi:hypothetical protein